MKGRIILILMNITVVCFSQSVQAVMDSVSVDPETGYIQIAWSPSGLDTTSYYVVSRMRFHDIIFPITSEDLDTIPYDNTLFYIDDMVDANIRYEGYRVAGSHPPYSDFHKIMHLECLTDSCTSSFFLIWNQYYGWKGTILYRIYDYDNLKFLGETTNEDTVFVFENPDPRRNYNFFVRAYSEDGKTSTSNKASFNSSELGLVESIISQSVDVSASGINLSFQIEPESSKFSKYVLYRFNNTDMQKADIIQTIEDNDKEISIIDKSINPENIYYYKLGVIDSCDKSIFYSDSVFNIVLNIKVFDNEVLLSWSNGNIWNQGGVSYEIYERINNVANILNTTINREYNRDIIELKGEKIQNKICYQIRAINGSFHNTSNESCVDLEPEVYIPKSFTPDSHTNYELIPTFDYVPKDFEFVIIDRTGKELFKTKDLNVGWRAENCSQGTYLYRLIYYDVNGNKKILTGYVNVIRNIN